MTQAAEPDLELFIVGAGFGGLAMLARARAMGWRALAVESAPSVGGTWYHNRYPGARVDIPSVEYSFAFDEALQQQWSWQERYASQPELLRYADHVADRLGLRPQIRLSTRLAEAHWDEGRRIWQLRSDAGDAWTARFVVMATGPLSTPYTPAFPGLDRYRGRLLHTADWPHQRVDFGGQRVGVIGTGSSGLQVVPVIAREAASLTVFQRTPCYVVPAHNAPMDPAYEARIKADYRGFRERSRATYGGFGSEHPRHPQSALAVSAEEREAQFERRWAIGGFVFLGSFDDVMTDLRANEFAAEFVRRKMRSIVRDPATAELLAPRYPIGCKRLCVDSGGYWQTFNQPHVRLVDVNAAPIEGFGERGVITGGHEHELDAVVLATGFDAVTGTLTRLPVTGRNGVTFAERWRDGACTQLGLMTSGFPNLFHLAGAGSSAALTSVILSIEHHVDWIARCIGWLREQGHAVIEADAAAESAWTETLQRAAEHTVFVGCDSWYLGANIPGKARRIMMFTGGFPLYAQLCERAAASGYAGFRCA